MSLESLDSGESNAPKISSDDADWAELRLLQRSVFGAKSTESIMSLVDIYAFDFASTFQNKLYYLSTRKTA